MQDWFALCDMCLDNLTGSFRVYRVSMGLYPIYWGIMAVELRREEAQFWQWRHHWLPLTWLQLQGWQAVIRLPLLLSKFVEFNGQYLLVRFVHGTDLIPWGANEVPRTIHLRILFCLQLWAGQFRPIYWKKLYFLILASITSLWLYDARIEHLWDFLFLPWWDFPLSQYSVFLGFHTKTLYHTSSDNLTNFRSSFMLWPY